MKELEAFMKAFGIVTETARRNVLIALFGIMFLMMLASISFGVFMYKEFMSRFDRYDKDKDGIYRDWLEDVREIESVLVVVEEIVFLI